MTNLKNTFGFTIIEIITVLVLISIIAAFVIGRAGTTDTDLHAQYEVLKTHLRYAQFQAMNSTFKYGIQSDAGGDNYWLFKYDTSQSPPEVKIRLPGEDSDQVNLSGKGLSMTAAAIVVFDNRGIPYTGTADSSRQTADRVITLSGSSETFNISITKNTGFVP